ncbi:MAG: response regulator transcription factor [Caldilineaceae bacterium]
MTVAREAADGEEALARFRETRPDVVLMDVRMPGMDGVEATRRLRAMDPAAKVIILTTFDDDEYVRGLRAVVGYLLKALSAKSWPTPSHRGRGRRSSTRP